MNVTDTSSRATAHAWPSGLESLLDSISEGVLLVDACADDLPIVYINRAFEELTGYRADEVFGRNCRFLQGADREQSGREVLRGATRDGRKANTLLRNYRKDGTRFWNELTIFPLRDVSGKVTHFVGVQADVTARIEPQTRLAVVSEDLKVSQAQLQATFDSMTDGVIVLDSKVNIVRLNRAAALLFDLKDAALSNQQIEAIFEVYLPDGSLLSPEQWPSTRAVWGAFSRNQEFTIRRKDSGRTVIVEISSAPVIGPSGGIGQILVTFRDITESRKVTRSRDLLAAIVESSQDAIIGKDIHGIVASWNRGAEKLFGYSSSEMVGQSVRKLLPEDLLRQEDDILARIQQGETVDHFETKRLTKSGVSLHVSLTISPIRDASGKVIGASKIARDISEQKHTELQLRQSQKMQAIGQLTGGIAHDFNNLLGVIVGNLDLLERLIAGNEAALRRVHTAQKASARGASLTRRLLAFSSNESLEPRVAVLAEAVNNTLEFAARAIGPEIKVVTHMDPTLQEVFIDVASLESALLNLVVNARDAMPTGGLLSISTELRQLEWSYPPVQAGELREGSYACVSVSDSGHGMSKDVLERAFEPFFTTKPRNKGTGLGLAMVYGFAKQSGGTVRIYSEPGYGTTVSLYLPLAIGPVAPEPFLSEAEHDLLGQSVLVVDDEEDLLDIAIAYLQDMGVTAHSACDGPAALEMLRLHPDISLMITDIIMPGGMNGVELAGYARQSFPGVRVIYCSGFPAESLAERSMPLIDRSLLHKPYQRAEFEKAVMDSMKASFPAG